ncbi:MAG: Crp/Fnr family transcriptional regulator [Bdellovibrionaceae bacterium]|nr:Crp/Fnr family transcriptional regulator [Bdellovibrionales bacterium]MCB9255268.1 Crp/Fnr family transcriptional regulator [Pseudobdellovibrionaceae bacterium]
MDCHQTFKCSECSVRNSSLFAGLSPEELEQLNACRSIQHFKRRERVFTQGETALGVHCVHRGKLRLFQSSESGKEQTIRLIAEGGVVGTESLLTEKTYTVCAETLEDAEVCFLEKKTFFDLLGNSPHLARKLLQSLATEIQAQEETISTFSQKSVRERVAQTLLALNDRFGSQAENGSCLRIPLKREEIATLSGTVLESAVRCLSEFRDDGFIDLVGREIYVVAPDKLRAIAEGKTVNALRR